MLQSLYYTRKALQVNSLQAVKAPSVKEESIDGDDNGWDEWQDIETPATKK